ncbi:oxalurate catabolism protein HpxZ [Phytohabitans rumicis]|uniref:DUF4440 domain-containing protein n=1 Tax=Phytohabitans rumicis TaxID=1076125 RepID=A0A6V8L5P7_9ACTN|nr:oxalurate catabolism protein HpxZ [Phytohabitans rumicis]GFJ92582.1 hypothetical protein Prum_062240 [Phytohabitans rumicis]
MRIDRPEVVAEVAAAFAGYEKALVDGDADLVAGYFWESAATVRYGIADHQVGYAEQLAWRRAQSPLPPGRKLRDTRISTFGTDCAVTTTFFTYPGRRVVGRQSQTWIRFPEGWRIVSAHVSEIPPP